MMFLGQGVLYSFRGQKQRDEIYALLATLPLINSRNLDQNVGQKDRKRLCNSTFTEARSDFAVDTQDTMILRREL